MARLEGTRHILAVRDLRTATDFCMFLLHEAHVSLVTGEAFGDGQCIRFSYAASEEKLSEALKRIREACARLQ